MRSKRLLSILFMFCLLITSIFNVNVQNAQAGTYTVEDKDDGTRMPLLPLILGDSENDHIHFGIWEDGETDFTSSNDNVEIIKNYEVEAESSYTDYHTYKSYTIKAVKEGKTKLIWHESKNNIDHIAYLAVLSDKENISSFIENDLTSSIKTKAYTEPFKWFKHVIKNHKFVLVHYIKYTVYFDIFNNNIRYYGRDMYKVHFDLVVYNGKKKFKTYKNQGMSHWVSLNWNNIDIGGGELYATKKIKLKNKKKINKELKKIKKFKKNIRVEITNIRYGKKTYEEFYKTFSYEKETIQFPLLR